MVVVRERVTDNGMAYFDIIETRTGLYQRLDIDPHIANPCMDFVLANVVSSMEREATSMLVVNGSNAAIIDAFPVRSASDIGDMTLREYCDSVFWPRKTVSIAENTRDCWQKICVKRIYPQLGSLPMKAITSAHITDFLVSVQAEGLKHSTVVKHFTVLNNIFGMAYRAEEIPRNPMDKVLKPTPRKDELIVVKPDAYTAEEIAYIEKCIAGEPLKWKAFILLLADTGIRRGECCALKWEHINFATNTITITGNLCYTKAKGVYLDTPKNQRVRIISVAEDVMDLLHSLHEESQNKSGSEYVFSQRKSTRPIHPQSPSWYFAKLRKKYDIPRFHPHKLRHTFASIAITNGADVASVSEILGHCDKAVTLRMYTTANEESMKQASNIRRQAVTDAKKHK